MTLEAEAASQVLAVNYPKFSLKKAKADGAEEGFPLKRAASWQKSRRISRQKDIVAARLQRMGKAQVLKAR